MSRTKEEWLNVAFATAMNDSDLRRKLKTAMVSRIDKLYKSCSQYEMCDENHEAMVNDVENFLNGLKPSSSLEWNIVPPAYELQHYGSQWRVVRNRDNETIYSIDIDSDSAVNITRYVYNENISFVIHTAIVTENSVDFIETDKGWEVEINTVVTDINWS